MTMYKYIHKLEVSLYQEVRVMIHTLLAGAITIQSQIWKHNTLICDQASKTQPSRHIKLKLFLVLLYHN